MTPLDTLDDHERKQASLGEERVVIFRNHLRALIEVARLAKALPKPLRNGNANYLEDVQSDAIHRALAPLLAEEGEA